MKYLILNLQDPCNSDVLYKVNGFPDGQRSITLINTDELYQKVHVIISSSICSFSDWELVLSAISAIKAHTLEYSFYAPYVLGARSDRKFEVGGDFYFADIVKKILDDMKCNIYLHDLHCESNFNIIHPFTYSKFEYLLGLDLSGYTFVFPDESAEMRFTERSLMPLVDKCTFKKERVQEEVIQKPKGVLDSESLSMGNDFIIVDDLFDGGASFINLCEKLRNDYGKTGEIIIFVTHFIGSNLSNLKKLDNLNVEIITTNSYGCSREASTYVTQIDVFNKDYILEMCNASISDL